MIDASIGFQAGNARLDKAPIYLVDIAGYGVQLSNVGGAAPWIESIDTQTLAVNDLDGSADLGQFSFTVQDADGAITSAFPTTVFEGKTVTLKTGWDGLAQSDFVTLFTGKVDSVASVNGNASYQFVCVDNKDRLSQTIYGTATDGFITDQDHRRKLNAHPLDILLNILTAQLSPAYTSPEIDTAGITAYRDGPFAGVQFTFDLDSAVVAKDFIEQQLLKPLGGYLWVNNLGQVKVNFFYPVSGVPAAAMDLTMDHFASTPEAGQIDLINQVQFNFDKDPGGTFLARSNQSYAASIAKYGQYGLQTIEADGLRAGFQGFSIAGLVSRLIFYRYGLKNLMFPAAELFWECCLLEPGDLVTVTHPTVPDRLNGVIGVKSQTFEVFDRTWDFDNGRVTLVLRYADYFNKFGFFLIAPNGTADYVPATQAVKDKYMFVCGAGDTYSNGDAAHVLG